jgi:hypothetical protein
MSILTFAGLNAALAVALVAGLTAVMRLPLVAASHDAIETVPQDEPHPLVRQPAAPLQRVSASGFGSPVSARPATATSVVLSPMFPAVSAAETVSR